MRVAITGASGFLGRSLVDVLTAAGHACRGLSRTVQPGSVVDWVQGSLADDVALHALVADADAVIHAALDRPGLNFIDQEIDVARFATQNVIGTIRLIEAARRAGVSRCVVVSSGAVHDDILDDRPLDETHPLWPHSHYGATKAAIEAFVHSYGRGQQFPVCAVRPTAIYGRADPLSRSRWYPLIAAIVRGEDVTCRNGAKVVHTHDVARACLLLLTANGVAGEVFHCTDLFVADRQIAEIARLVAGTRSEIAGEPPRLRHPIKCRKLKDSGMQFGGEALLQATVGELVELIRSETSKATPNNSV